MPLESGAQGQGPTDTKAKAPQAADRRLTDGAHIVDFDGDDDPANPLNWSRGRKWAIVSCLSAALTVANLATVLCIPAVPQILRSFGTSNQLYSTIIVSVWEVGQAVGPLFVAPLSEMYGTTLVYNGTNIIFIVFSVACALSNKQGMLIAFRLFNGLGDSSQALNARIVGDMFPQQERGLPMSISGLPPLLGPVAGPIIGGYLTETEGWQWAFWLMAIVMGVLELTFVLVYRETYRPHLLRRKAQKLSKEAEGIRFISIDDVDKERPSWRTLATYLFRPAQILFRSPVVAMLAVIMSVIYGVSYTLLTTITEVFEGVYGFTQGEAGLAYLGLSLGTVLGVLVCAFTLDRMVKKQIARHGCALPEHRLPPMLFGALTFPLGLLLYGWSAEYRVFFLVPMVGTAFAGFAFCVTTIPLQAYLVDAFKTYSASAISATVTVRCLTAAVLPLAGPPIYDRLGLGWGNSLLGLIVLAFAPLPYILMRHGERMRARGTIRT